MATSSAVPLIPRLTTSERAEFCRCPQAWWWKYREGLTAKEQQTDARWFGTGVHAALAQWYKPGKQRGLRPDVAFLEWMRGQENDFIRTVVGGEPKYEKARELGAAMLEHYYRTWGWDEHWDIIATEQFGQALVPQIESSPDPLALYSFTFDGVLRDRWREIWLLENKTAGQIRLGHLQLDDQAGSYVLFATTILRHMGILGPKDKIAGILYNFLRKAMPDLRDRDAGGKYLNKDGSVSKVQPSPFFVRKEIERSPGQLRAVLRRIQDHGGIMLDIREGLIPVTKSIGKECAFCDFLDMCELHEQGGPAWEDFRDTVYRRADPYAYQHKDASA